MSVVPTLMACVVPAFFAALYALGRHRTARFIKALSPFIGHEIVLHLATDGRTFGVGVATARLLSTERSCLVVVFDRPYVGPLSEPIRANERTNVPLRLVMKVTCGDESVELRRSPRWVLPLRRS